MSTGDALGAMAERIGRARACVEASQASIARSWNRIACSLIALSRSSDRFDGSGPALGEEQAATLHDHAAAHVEQCKIDREVRLSTRRDDSVPA